MNSEELRSARVETARAKDSVKTFFEACVPYALRPKFVDCAMRHEGESYSHFLKLKEAIENPSDMPSHNLNCSNYVKESKRLIRAVSFVLLKAYPNGNPDFTKYHWSDIE